MKLRHLLFITLAIACDSPTTGPKAEDNTVTAEITPATMTLQVGGTGTLQASLYLINTIFNFPKFTWTVENAGDGVVSLVVASDQRTVTLTGLKKGQATVRATSLDRTGVIATAIITVIDRPQTVDHVTITPSSMDLSMEEDGQFNCRAFDAQGVEVNSTFTWSTNAVQVAGVTLNTGKISPQSPGTATITCRDPVSTLTASASVAIHARVIEVTPSTVTLAPGQKQNVTPVVKNFRGAVIPNGGQFMTWQSNNTSVVTTSASGPTSELVAVANGNTTVSIKLGTDASFNLPVTVAAAAQCWPASANITFRVRLVSDPGGYSGTITLQTLAQLIAVLTTSGGKIRLVGGGTMNGYPNQNRLDVSGNPPSASNGCAVSLDEQINTFGPGQHKTKLSGNAVTTPGTKLTLQFLTMSGVLEAEYELEVVSVQ